MKNKKYTNLLGLAFENNHLELSLLRRSGTGVTLEKNLRVPLQLDPLSAEPQLAGQEIRNHLDATGIRERSCVICLPLKWVLTLHVDLPKLEGEDLDSFIALQTERSFPFPPEDLAIAVSRVSLGDETGQATIVAFPRNHLNTLEMICKAAGLRPVMITISAATLPSVLSPPGNEIAIWAGEGEWDLVISAKGGVAFLRSLERSYKEDPSDASSWDCEGIARQLRITLGRLPRSLRAAINSLRVYGPAERVGRITKGLEAPLAPLGLRVEAGMVTPGQEDMGKMPAPLCSPSAWGAAGILQGENPLFNLLPPHLSRFQQLASRISARRALYLGGAVGTILLFLGLVFGIQALQLQNLENRWNGMKDRVKTVEDLQSNVRKFRPWFDTSVTSLRIMTRLAQAFPAEGTVWVKTIEIKGMEQVTCTGNARSSRDWLAALDALRKTDGISDLQVAQVRGENPLQFSLTFRWEENASDAR